MGRTLSFFDLDTRQLLRIRPNPLTAADISRLRGVRPAGPFPVASQESVQVRRRVSSTGVVMVARQSVALGRVPAGKTVTIDVSDTDLVVACDDGPGTFRRTTELPARNLKADRPRKVTNKAQTNRNQEPSMIMLADIRRYAMALPDVVEKPHFRLPGFRVADKVLAHLEKGNAHAIVCVGQEQAKTAAALEPDIYEEVWRNGRIFVGLRVDLAKVTQKRMQELIQHAWRNRAPKRLVAEYDSRLAVEPSIRPAAG